MREASSVGVVEFHLVQVHLCSNNGKDGGEAGGERICDTDVETKKAKYATYAKNYKPMVTGAQAKFTLTINSIDLASSAVWELGPRERFNAIT